VVVAVRFQCPTDTNSESLECQMIDDQPQVTLFSIQSRGNSTPSGLSGSIASSLTQLSALKVLLIQFEQGVTGTIPPLPSQLIKFELAYVSLNATLPPLPSRLTKLRLSAAGMYGTLPSFWPTNLRFLKISDNRLGVFPCCYIIFVVIDQRRARAHAT
jgi:hypothetical protein